MRFILYFIFFYILFRIVHSLVRRALFGPKKRSSFYVNWGSAGGAAGSPRDAYSRAASEPNADEPMVGGRAGSQKNVSAARELRNIQEAEFVEVSESTESTESTKVRD
jgi:hypothetical protein